MSCWSGSGTGPRPGHRPPRTASPDDAAADLQAELRPLIASLDEVEDEVRALLDAAAAEAATIRERGARDAERILDDARLQAAGLRAAPPDEGPDDEALAILARAAAEADGVLRRARNRVPGLVARVVSCVRGGAEPEPVPKESGVAGVGRG